MHTGSIAAVWSTRRIKHLALGAVLLLGAALAPATVYAGKQSAQAPWIALATVDGASSAARTAPALGSWVTFASSYPTNVKNPRIEVLCYQSGALTFGMAGGIDYSFQLGGGGSLWLWSGGEADCTANLFYFGWKGGMQTYNRLASTGFHAEA